MITFETQEEFELAVENVIRQLSIQVSDYNSDYYNNNSKGVTVELSLNREVISSDSTSI